MMRETTASSSTSQSIGAIHFEEQRFWKAWDVAAATQCFRYKLNRAMVSLFLAFDVSVIVVVTVITTGFDATGWPLLTLWVLAGVIIVATVIVLFVWRTLARRSAVLINDRGLSWLYAGRSDEIPWSAIDRNHLGKALEGARQTRGILRFEVEGKACDLLVYNPFMRLENFPDLMLGILQHLDRTRAGGPAGQGGDS